MKYPDGVAVDSATPQIALGSRIGPEENRDRVRVADLPTAWIEVDPAGVAVADLRAACWKLLEIEISVSNCV